MHENSNDPAYVGAPDTATGIALIPDQNSPSHHHDTSSESAPYAEFSTGGDLLPNFPAVDTAHVVQQATGVAAPVEQDAAAPGDPFRLDLVQMESAMVLAMIANEYFARTPLPTPNATAPAVQGATPEPVKLGLAGRMSIRSVKVKSRPHIESDLPAEAVAARFEELFAAEAATEPLAEPAEPESTEAEPAEPETAEAEPASPTPPRQSARITNVIAFPLAAKYMR